ncbi:ankyrin repeat-containing domain protein [Flagelloscypha sp. PMI_526]|nr:ankyrin repeat-containing domain protein [Flagelloscypha sp. PMI_526]
MARSIAPKCLIPLTALAFDGTSHTLNALSELYILQEAAGRWAHDSELCLRGEDVCPSQMFDMIGGTGIGGFYAVLFARLGLTIGQAIRAHRVLEERLFTSETWSLKQHTNSLDVFNQTLDEIFSEFDIATSLNSAFEDGIPSTKCVVCVLNVESAGTCRLLRNYRPRGSQSPACTIRQALQATFADSDYLPSVRIQDEDFISALNGYASPVRVLMKELGNTFPKRSMVACVASIGAGYSTPPRFKNHMDSSTLAHLLQSSELVAQEFASQCHELGAFFFRFSIASQLSHASTVDQAYSRVKGSTMTYLDMQETTKKLDGLVEALMEHPEVVSLERLGSLAGNDGQSELATRVRKVQEHIDNSLYRNINEWLEPIQQTSKLDANIRARGETTCEWILHNETFTRWMEALGGLFWYHGLMGTGKTFTSSFIIQSLLKRDDIYVAYYYFEFTNPITLSEEALYRSLVSQLTRADPVAIRCLYQKHNHGGHQPQLPTLQSTLKGLISASPKPIFIIIDALDELPLAQRKYLFQSLSEFCHSSGGFRTHVMLTSREDRDIRDALEETVDFQLGVQGDLVRQDIAAYIDQKLAVKKWTFWPRDQVEFMRQVLNKRADGQFRMVACQVDILMQAETSDMLIKALHSLPTTLGNTYEYILNNIREDLRSSARVLFSFLCFTDELIRIPELNALIAVDFGDASNPDQLPAVQKANLFRDSLGLVELGASLVSLRTDWDRKESLQLAHASVKEYLLADSGKWFALQESLAHNLIASACIAVLLHFQVLKRRYFSRIAPCSYSLENWFKHIFPKGPSVLLNQQKALYDTLPWSMTPKYVRGYRERDLLSSAAAFGLLDFLKTSLITTMWNDYNCKCALIAAAGSSRSSVLALQGCRLLLRHCDKLYSHKDFDEALQAACGASNLEVVQFFAGKGGNVNATRGYGWASETALQAATESGNMQVIQFLVEAGANVNATGEINGPPLYVAAKLKHLEVARFLVEKGADVNVVGGEYGTPLQAATWSRSLKVVRFLVENGADVNAVGGKYGTALQAAAWSRRLKVVRFLVENGADVNAVGGEYRTPLQAAAYSDGLKVVRFLVENGADVNAVGGKHGAALQAAALYVNHKIVRFLVENGADVNAIGGNHGTALQAAAKVSLRGLKLVRYLVAKGANVSVKAGIYGTALQAAAAHGSLEAVQFLVEKGADVTTIGGKYETALQAAAWSGNLKVVRFLVKNGADVTTAGGEHGTALHAAARSGSLKVARFLVKKGADVHMTGGKYGVTLQAAARGSNIEVATFLVGKGVDVNMVGGKWGTALHLASQFGDPEMVQFLVSIGADLNATGRVERTPLDCARARFRQSEVIGKYLVERGAKTYHELTGRACIPPPEDE